MTQIWNCALLFERGDDEAFVEYSRSAVSGLPNDFCLGARSLPHLTILQFEAADDAIADIWSAVQPLVAEPRKLELAGLTFLPTKEKHVWIEIQVLKAKWLAELQSDVVGLVGSAKIHSGIGDSYRPHITIARVIDQPTALPLDLDLEVVRRKDLRGRISIGVSGDNFQYSEIRYAS